MKSLKQLSFISAILITITMPSSVKSDKMPAKPSRASGSYAATMKQAIINNDLDQVREILSKNRQRIHETIFGTSSAIVFTQLQCLDDSKDRTHISRALIEEFNANPQDKNICGVTAQKLALKFYKIP